MKPVGPANFVDINIAATLFPELQADRGRYPTQRNLDKHEGDSSLIEQVEQSLALDVPAVVMWGMPSRGKTFHALLVGLKWAARGRQGQKHARRKSPHAYYAPAKVLDTSLVLDLFDDAQEFGPTLCILDDIHETLGVCLEIVDAFKEESLSDLGHRLLLISRSKPDELQDIPSVPVLLSPHCIRYALKAAAIDIPPPEVLQSLAAKQTLGIDAILWAGKYDPNLLNDPASLETAWLEKWMKPLNADETAAAVQLSRLKFLGLTYPHLLQTTHALERLGMGGYAHRATHPQNGWSMSDGLARAVFRHYVKTTDIRTTLLQPLSELLRLAPNEMCPIIDALSTRTQADVERLIGENGTARTSLLAGFIEAAADIIYAIMRDQRTSLVAAATVLATCSKHSPVQAEVWARDLLKLREKQILVELSNNDPATWRAIRVLSIVGRTDTFESGLRTALATADFRNKLEHTPTAEQNGILSEIRRFNLEAFVGIEGVLLPQRKRVKAFWRSVRRLAGSKPSIVVDVMKGLSIQTLRWAVIGRPRDCVAFWSGSTGETDSKCNHCC